MPDALSAHEIDEALRKLPQWRLQNGKLVREWKFEDFVAAMNFVSKIAEHAESVGHHPDIDIRYNHVLLGMVSHDAGGITTKDVAMAERIDGLV